MKLQTREQYESWRDRLRELRVDRSVDADWSASAQWIAPYARLMAELQQGCQDSNVTSLAKLCAKTLVDLRTAERQPKIDRCRQQMIDYEDSLDVALGMHLQDYTPAPRLH